MLVFKSEYPLEYFNNEHDFLSPVIIMTYVSCQYFRGYSQTEFTLPSLPPAINNVDRSLLEEKEQESMAKNETIYVSYNFSVNCFMLKMHVVAPLFLKCLFYIVEKSPIILSFGKMTQRNV